MGKLVYKKSSHYIITSEQRENTKRMDAHYQSVENHQNFVVAKNRECESKVLNEFKKDLSVNRIDPTKFELEITRG